MTRSLATIGIALAFATFSCGRPTDGAPPTQQGRVTSVPDVFALIARVPESESEALEALLAKSVIPAIGASHLVRSMDTYSARDGNEVVYAVTVSLIPPGSHSPNVAFEILSSGRSFEDARALQEQVKRYFRASPILAEHRSELSVKRLAAAQVVMQVEGK